MLRRPLRRCHCAKRRHELVLASTIVVVETPYGWLYRERHSKISGRKIVKRIFRNCAAIRTGKHGLATTVAHHEFYTSFSQPVDTFLFSPEIARITWQDLTFFIITNQNTFALLPSYNDNSILYLNPLVVVPCYTSHSADSAIAFSWLLLVVKLPFSKIKPICSTHTAYKSFSSW